MQQSKKNIFKTPYLYIFALTFFCVWVLWDFLRITSPGPSGVVSTLGNARLDPSTNIARFFIAVIAPPIVCWGYWFISQKKITGSLKRANRNILFALCVLLALMVAISQASTNPANNSLGEYGGPYSYALLDTFHEGETLGPAISYQQPNLKPYRDFTIVHGVFQDPLRSVIAFKLFGKSIGATRTFAVLLTMLALVLYFLLLYLLFRGNVVASLAGFSILAILMLPRGTIPVLDSTLIGVQFPFRDIATIAFLASAVWSIRLLPRANNRLMFVPSLLIGFIVTAGFANSIDRALYIFFLSFVWLFLVLLMSNWRYILRAVIPYVIIGASLGIVVLGLALKWDYGSFLSYLFTMGSQKEYLDGIVFSRPNLPRTTVILLASALVMLGGVVFMAEHKKISRRELPHALKQFITKYPVEILLFITGIFFLRSALGRADFAHFAYSAQWLYLCIVYIVLTRIKISDHMRFLSRYMLLIVFFALLFLYASIVKNIDIRRDTFPIHIPDRAFVRPDYIETAAYLKQHLNPSQSFMTLTSEGSWYYLASRPSPTRYYIIWYAFLPNQKQELASTLKNNSSIKYVITNNNWPSSFDYIQNEQRFPELYAELHRLYRPVKGIGQQTVWQRM